MYYYIDTIEQVKGAEEGEINEYGKRDIKKDKDGNPMVYETVESAYHTALANVLNDLVSVDPSKNHYFMDIRIVNSLGEVLKKDVAGKYVEQ